MGEEGVLRAAAYCRVSTDKEEQRSSLAAQKAFFETYIAGQPGWVMAGLFADEGLSGTSAKRRPRFTAMVEQAMAGEIDLILTKEVSRFARNTVDTLQVTRELRARGVGVVFLNDNIDTREDDGEFRLTIMASVAQEESRKISERTRWGQLQAMRRGVAFGNKSLYGYDLSGGVLTVREEEAEVVRQVFWWFLREGKGAHAIARALTERGVKPPLRPAGAWSPAMVSRILRNEKYCGDLLQRKYVTVDHLTHRKEVNRGRAEQFCLRGHHEAIVSREDFLAAGEELARRAALAGSGARHSARYWYSGKLRCGCCGRTFSLKRTKRPDGTEYRRFVCRGHLDGTGECAMGAVRAEVVEAAARHALRLAVPDGAEMAAEVLRELAALRERGGDGGEEAAGLRRAMERQRQRRARAVDAFLDGLLTREELERQSRRCGEELVRLEGELSRLCSPPGERQSWREEAEICLAEELARGETLLERLVEGVTVEGDCFRITLAGEGGTFRVWARGEGRGESWRAVVDRWERA